MKYECHVPVEQYGYISVEVEGTAQDAVQAYDDIARVCKSGTGLSQKDFNDFLDTYLSTGKPPENGVALWEQMDKEQKSVINHVKLHIKRTK